MSTRYTGLAAVSYTHLLVTTYPEKFDVLSILRTELNVIYTHDNYQNKSPRKILVPTGAGEAIVLAVFIKCMVTT